MDHPTINMSDSEDPQRPPRGAVEIMEDSKALYDRKNDDYGDSWKLAGKTMAMWLRHQGLDELRVPATAPHMNALGLFTRRLDKMIREFNGWMCLEEGDDFRVDETIAETHMDDVPYGAMHAQLAEEYARADPDEVLP
jgi:hypothetical protein